MRRTPPTGREVTRAWRVPWWRRCRCCDEDFKFEHAWAGWWRAFEDIPKGIMATGPDPPAHKGFVCLRCSPTPEKAMAFFGLIKPARPMKSSPSRPGGRPSSVLGSAVPPILVKPREDVA